VRERSYLLRRARLQLGAPDVAEDVVQETLVAALLGFDRFHRRSTVRTWLVSILHNKIVDEIRRHLQQPTLYRPDLEAHEPADADDQEDGGPAHASAIDVPGPQAEAEARELFALVEQRLADVPRKHARAFVMRDILDHSSGHICAELGITSNNLFVMLHRTRNALRRTLQERGYERPRAARRAGAAR
jgi:RNA polymerase sigma-70 factor (TIGR02943 family)